MSNHPDKGHLTANANPDGEAQKSNIRQFVPRAQTSATKTPTSPTQSPARNEDGGGDDDPGPTAA